MLWNCFSFFPPFPVSRSISDLAKFANVSFVVVVSDIVMSYKRPQNLFELKSVQRKKTTFRLFVKIPPLASYKTTMWWSELVFERSYVFIHCLMINQPLITKICPENIRTDKIFHSKFIEYQTFFPMYHDIFYVFFFEFQRNAKYFWYKSTMSWIKTPDFKFTQKLPLSLKIFNWELPHSERRWLTMKMAVNSSKKFVCRKPSAIRWISLDITELNCVHQVNMLSDFKLDLNMQ